MALSSSSSDLEFERQRRPNKRYKLYLDADYDPLAVGHQTRKRWERKIHKSSQQQLPCESEGIIISDYAYADCEDESKEYDVSEDLSEYVEKEIQPSRRISSESNNESNGIELNEDNFPSSNGSTTAGTDIEQKSIDCVISLHDEDYNSVEENNVNINNVASYENDDEEINCDFDELSSSSMSIHEISHSSMSSHGISTNSMLSDDEPTVKKDATKALFDSIMFQPSKLTVRDVIVMTTAFALRFNLSDEAKLELMKMFTLCAGPNFDSVSLSKHIMSQYFSSQNEKITHHFYCIQCFENITYSISAGKKLKQQHTKCKKCEKPNIITTTSSNNFISVDIEYQMKKLLANKMIANNLLENSSFKRGVRGDENAIEGIHDSFLYKKVVNADRNDNYCVLTFNFNTDGAPLNKSGKRSFWLVQLIINQLSLKLQSQFIILTGIMIVDHEPDSKILNLFLSTVLVNQINELNKARLEITDRDTKIPIKFQLLSCTVDSVARPAIQNRLQFNGYYGCSWCYQLGLYVEEVHGIRYPVDQESVLRTNESHRKDINDFLEKASSNNQIPSIAIKTTSVRGVRGTCCLLQLPIFDMVWSFSFEYLHALLLGVVHAMWKRWKERKSNYKLSKKSIKEIEKRYLRITPTHEIHRVPRKGIIDGAAKPKGSELKSLHLYFGLPCLKDFLPDEALDHYCLLVKSSYTLLKETVTKSDLEQCEKDLQEFVVRYEQLYGESSVTFNVHSLTHIVESIKKTGLLCHNSAFPFESNIYVLKKKVNGPKAMDQQMSKKHLQSLTFKTGSMKNIVDSDLVTSYCSRLFMPKQLSTFYANCLDDVIFCGRSRTTHVDGLGRSLVYSKCIYKGSVLCSIKYKRALKTDDSYVQMQSGRYGRIIEIIKTVLSVVEVSPNNCFKGVDHIKKIESEDITRPVIRSITTLSCKMMVMNVRNDVKYLCEIANNVEVQ